MDESTRFALSVSEAAEHQRRARELIREAAMRMDFANRAAAESRGRGFSIVRAVRAMTAEGGGGLRTGYEAEVCEEAARVSGRTHDPHRVIVPWSVLTREMIVGTASSGGYLVAGDARGPAADALFPHSSVVRAGAQVLPNLTSDINVPRFGTNVSAGWLTESGTATAGAPVLAQIACTPKTVGAYVELSGRLLLQSDAEAVVSRHLLGVIGAAIDAAALAGTSADASQPLGIRYAAGVTVGTGTSFTNANTQAMLKAVGDGNARDDLVSFHGAPTTRQTLGARAENGTGSRFIWSGTDIAGHAAYVTASAPANTLFVGDYSNLWLPMWGVGPTVELNPYANFAAGVVGLRCFASADVAVANPAAFAVQVGVS